jgi:hypothetical protein
MEIEAETLIRALVEAGALEDLGDGLYRLLEEPAPSRKYGRVDLVFEAWKTSTGRTRVKLDEKRRRLIRNALKSYDLDDVLAAVDGWRFSPMHAGDNERQTVYNDLSLLLRDGEHIERFRDYKLGSLNGANVRSAERLAALESSQRKELTDGSDTVG